MNAAPPISPAKYGNFHTFPIPIAHPVRNQNKADPGSKLFSFHTLFLSWGTYTFCVGLRPHLHFPLSLFAKAYVPNELKFHYFCSDPLLEPCVMFYDQHGGLVS